MVGGTIRVAVQEAHATNATTDANEAASARAMARTAILAAAGEKAHR